MKIDDIISYSAMVKRVKIHPVKFQEDGSTIIGLHYRPKNCSKPIFIGTAKIIPDAEVRSIRLDKKYATDENFLAAYIGLFDKDYELYDDKIIFIVMDRKKAREVKVDILNIAKTFSISYEQPQPPIKLTRYQKIKKFVKIIIKEYKRIFKNSLR